MVNSQHLQNALDMALEEALDPDTNIEYDELIDIKNRFAGLCDKLLEDCEDSPEDTEDDGA
jgi:hypothetical protein